MGRTAKVWKSQQAMTDLKVINDDMKLESQLRVQRALRTMRTNVTPHDEPTAPLNIRRKKAQVPYSEFPPIELKDVRDLEKVAKQNHQKRKEDSKMLRQSELLGKPKIISPELIKEIKKEQEAEIQRRMSLKLNPDSADRLRQSSFVNRQSYILHAGSEDELVESSVLVSDQGNRMLRPLSASAATNINPRQRMISRTNSNISNLSGRPKTASGSRSSPNTSYLGLNNLNSDSVVLVATPDLMSPHPQHIQHKLSVQSYDHYQPHRQAFLFDDPRNQLLDEQIMSKYRQQSAQNLANEPDYSELRRVHTTQEYSTSKRVSNFNIAPSSGFAPSLIECDPRILKVLRQKEENMAARENAVMARIQQKEELLIMRMEKQTQLERQQIWLFLCSFLTRFSHMNRSVQFARTSHWQGLDASKRAILLISQWWSRRRITLFFRRNPKVMAVLRKLILRYVVTVRIKRKTAAASRLRGFLQDCTGISEWTRKLCIFRRKIITIQRYIRSWITMQMHRVRLLWKCAEMLGAKLLRFQRRDKMKEETQSLRATAQSQQFGETVVGINAIKRKLVKILDDQDILRVIEEERLRVSSLPRSAGDTATLGTNTYGSMNSLFAGTTVDQAAVNTTTNTTINAHSSSGLNLKAAGQQQHQQHQQHNQSMQSLKASQRKNTAMSTTLNSHNSNSNGLSDIRILSRVERRKRRHDRPWHVKIRHCKDNVRFFDQLRNLLKLQRLRHHLLINERKQRHVETKIDLRLLKRFLKEPVASAATLNSLTNSITDETMLTKQLHEIQRSPFLLLTSGGMEALEVLLMSQPHLRIPKSDI